MKISRHWSNTENFTELDDGDTWSKQEMQEFGSEDLIRFFQRLAAMFTTNVVASTVCLKNPGPSLKENME